MTIYYMALAKSPKMPRWSYGYVCAMFFFGTVQVVGDASNVTPFTVNDGQITVRSGGKAVFGLNICAATGFVLSMFFQDSMLVSPTGWLVSIPPTFLLSIQIYRILVIWNYNSRVILLPSLFLIISTGKSTKYYSVRNKGFTKPCRPLQFYRS